MYLNYKQSQNTCTKKRSELFGNTPEETRSTQMCRDLMFENHCITIKNLNFYTNKNADFDF
jgi:hypothetical protein